MNDNIVYNWERLEIYEQTNHLARLLGRLLGALPARLHIHVHNLIGQTILMSNAIAGGHMDVPTGEEPPSAEQRIAYFTIGETAAHSARKHLFELARVSKRSEIAEGLRLVAQIEAGFRGSIVHAGSRPDPGRVHLA